MCIPPLPMIGLVPTMISTYPFILSLIIFAINITVYKCMSVLVDHLYNLKFTLCHALVYHVLVSKVRSHVLKKYTIVKVN